MVLIDPAQMIAAIRAGDPRCSKVRASASLPAAALASAIRDSRATKELVLSGMRYTRAEFGALCEALSLADRLRVLDVSEMGLDEESLFDVVDFIAHSSSIARVDMSLNDVSPDVAAALGAALRDHPSMRTLVLRDVDLRDDGLDALLSTLGPDGCTLHKLALPHNGLTDQGAFALAAFVHKSTELTCVVHSGNTVPVDAAKTITASCARNVTRLGFDPSSRPSSMMTARGGARTASQQKLEEQAAAYRYSALLPETALLLACEDGPSILPTLSLLMACEMAG